MRSPSRLSRQTLQTPRLSLREFADDDGEAVQLYAGDAEVTRFTSWGPNTPEVTASVIHSWLAEQSASPRCEWPLAIIRDEDRALIGGTGIHEIDWHSGTAGFGYVLRRSAWGHGYATEAGRAVTHWALSDLALQRLVAHCQPEHAGSINVLKKLGFEQQNESVSLPRLNGEIRSYLVFLLET